MKNNSFSFRIGYYLGGWGEKRIILSIGKDSLEVMSITKEQTQGALHRNWGLMNDYSLRYPVVFQEHGQVIENVCLLSELPDSSTTKTGLAIDVFGLDSNLFYDNRPQFGSVYNMAQGFYRWMIRCHVLKRNIQELSTVLNEYFFINCVDRIETYINEIDLDKELIGLSINVHEEEQTKVGGDDTYSVWKTISVPSIRAQNDKYLKKVIGLGHKELYSDRGYTSSYILKKDAQPILKERCIVIGEYTPEQIEKEKAEILSRYSVIEHKGYLLYEEYENYKRRIERKDELENEFLKTKDTLFKESRLSVIAQDISSKRVLISKLRDYTEHSKQTLLDINLFLQEYTKISPSSKYILSCYAEQDEE